MLITEELVAFHKTGGKPNAYHIPDLLEVVVEFNGLAKSQFLQFLVEFADFLVRNHTGFEYDAFDISVTSYSTLTLDNDSFTSVTEFQGNFHFFSFSC